MTEPTLFERARGHIIRGHELAMGLAIAALIGLSSVLFVGLFMTNSSVKQIKDGEFYQLGYDVGVFCDADAKSCSVICVNNLKQEYAIAQCTRGIYNGYNEKADFPIRNYVERPTGE